MTYADRTLTCVDCGVEFIHSAADQEFYTQKAFVSDPKRCSSCRASRRAGRESTDYDLRDIGPTWLRARRSADPGVLRGPLLVVRQPGPGPVQATNGSPRLLLGLLPQPLGQLGRSAQPARRALPASEREAGPRSDAEPRELGGYRDRG